MTQATDQALVAAAPPVRAIPGNEAAKGPQPGVALTDPGAVARAVFSPGLNEGRVRCQPSFLTTPSWQARNLHT
jgi:hypothetical protein